MVRHDEPAAGYEPRSRRYTSSPHPAAGSVVALRRDTPGRIAQRTLKTLRKRRRDHVFGTTSKSFEFTLNNATPNFYR